MTSIEVEEWQKSIDFHIIWGKVDIVVRLERDEPLPTSRPFCSRGNKLTVKLRNETGLS